MWTRFMDMHSGGRTKEPPYQHIYIEAPEDEARLIFYNRFGHNPERVTCTCCGEDYSVSSDEELSQLTAFDRGCRFAYPGGNRYDGGGRYLDHDESVPDGWSVDVNGFSRGRLSLAEYFAREDVLMIRAYEIKASEREGEVPEQGYVWKE